MPYRAGGGGWSLAGGPSLGGACLRSALAYCHPTSATAGLPDGADPGEVDAWLIGGILLVRRPEDGGWISGVARPGGVAARGGGRCHETVSLLPRPAWQVQAG